MNGSETTPILVKSSRFHSGNSLHQCIVGCGSVWIPIRDDGCGPVLVVTAGLGFRRGGKELAGRINGGGGWLRVGLGWTNRACCWRGGGCRCNAGAAGRVGRRRGGGWFKAVTEAVGVGATDCAGGDWPEGGAVWLLWVLYCKKLFFCGPTGIYFLIWLCRFELFYASFQLLLKCTVHLLSVLNLAF